MLPYAQAAGPLSIQPSGVACPVDADDVSTVLRWAAHEGIPLVPRGAGTGMPGGNVGTGIALDLSACFGSLDPVDVSSGTIRAEPGVLAGEVDRAARKAGLFLPPLPSSADRCTVGGMVANNAAGARTFKYGATRDWIEALDVVTADGSQHTLGRGGSPPSRFTELHTELRAELGSTLPEWPRVRKNSSGYALDRFLPDADPVQLVVGSEGTIAVVTAVTLRLAPVPEAQAVVLIAVRDLIDLPILLQWARENGASACEFFGRRFLEIAAFNSDARIAETLDGAEASLLVELDGDQDTVSRAADSIRSLARELGVKALVGTEDADRAHLWRVRHAASPLIAESAQTGLVSTQIIEDSVVPPEALHAYLSGLDDILHAAETDAVIFGHAGDANVHVNHVLL